MSLQSLYSLDSRLLLWFNGSDSVFADNIILVLTSGLTWLPLYLALLYLVIRNNETMLQIVIVIACAVLCVALSGILSDLIIKPLVARPRPCYDAELSSQVTLVRHYRASGYSFFSSHAANTFSLAMFFACLVRSRFLSIMLVVWSLVNCYTRLYLGVHYPSDILVGLIWGGAVGVLIASMHARLLKRTEHVARRDSTTFTSSGYERSHVHVVAFALLICLLYANFKAVVL